jgi:hypothetical protein
MKQSRVILNLRGRPRDGRPRSFKQVRRSIEFGTQLIWSVSEVRAHPD